MKTKTIYLVRHGFRYDQTENNTWNISERFIENPLDTPLAEEGKKEIQKLLTCLKESFSTPSTVFIMALKIPEYPLFMG
jgi:broad specificity phosphatase PhoE